MNTQDIRIDEIVWQDAGGLDGWQPINQPMTLRPAHREMASMEHLGIRCRITYVIPPPHVPATLRPGQARLYIVVALWAIIIAGLLTVVALKIRDEIMQYVATGNAAEQPASAPAAAEPEPVPLPVATYETWTQAERADRGAEGIGWRLALAGLPEALGDGDVDDIPAPHGIADGDWLAPKPEVP